MKRKIFIAIIAALAAMCVLAVSVGAYNWKIGTITKSMHVIVDGVIKYKEKDVCGFVKTDNDTQTVSIIYDTESYNYDGWFSSETPREDLVTDDMSIYSLLPDTSIARSAITNYRFYAVFTTKSTDPAPDPTPDPDPIPVTRNVQFSAGTGGTASLSDGAPETFVSGETYSFTVTAAAQDGYQFTGWKCGDAVISTEPVLTFTDAVWTADTTYTAEFEQKAVTPAKVTVTFAAESGGYLSGDELTYTVNYGENMPMPTIMAVAEDRYRFAGWYLGEKNVCSGYSFNMDTMRCTEDITITARFVRELKLTFVTELAGTFNGSAEAKFDIGTQAAVNVSVSAKDGYRFLGWYDGDALACSEAEFSYNTTTLTEDKTFTAKFAPVEYTIRFKAGTGGSVSSGDPVTVKHGEQPAMTASAAADKGYRFAGWYTEGRLVCTDAEFTFPEPVMADAEFTARFAELAPVTILYRAEDAVMGYVTRESEILNPESGVPEGSVAVEGLLYRFVGWYCDGELVCETKEFIPSEVKAVEYTARFTEVDYVTITYKSENGLAGYV
ncbi:MAG: InlB B-repeat-containing protein, partial [Clostridia bacterium]|nr:InlB B-repeat-containing protein [Clostridia bacterium]